MLHLDGRRRFGSVARGGITLALACSGLLMAHPTLAASGGASSAHSNGNSAVAPGHNKGASAAAAAHAGGPSAAGLAHSNGAAATQANASTGSAASSSGGAAAAGADGQDTSGGAASAPSAAVAYGAQSTGTAGLADLMATPLVGLLPPPLMGSLLLICPQLTLAPDPACKLPFSPPIKSILGSTGGIRTTLASTGDLAPWSMLTGVLLLLAGMVAIRRRTRKAQRPPAAG